ncbi:MAG: hypothetical protein NT118_15430 [Lentisphaerae bacterium]|nr:hypothetical protein [Lentisphaerota bacterium]
MKILRLSIMAALLLTSSALLSSCKSEDNVKMGMVKDVAHFPKIKDPHVEFDCVSPIRTFRINEPAVLVFRLTNLADKNLVVYEWRMIDDYNIKLFVAPWQEGTEKTIDFKKDVIKKDIDKPQTFIVYGELYLESIPLKSRPATITINP